MVVPEAATVWLADTTTETSGTAARVWLELEDGRGDVSTCVGLSETRTTGDAPCDSVLLLLTVRVELGEAACEALCDRLGELECEAGGAALNEADSDADCEEVAVGVRPLVTVWVAESV